MTSSLIELDSNKWSHLILSYSLGKVKVYVKGQLKSQSQGILNFDLPVTLFLVKRVRDNDSSGGSRYWKGKFDDLGIWDRALTQSEIDELYQTKATSVQEDKYNTILIYPNPTNTFVIIDCANINDVDIYTCQITNSLGQEKMSSQFSTRFQQIDISGLGGAGLYIISIKDASNSMIETRKLLIQ